jgi:drug/metabolite transporter (DMT)-like permease
MFVLWLKFIIAIFIAFVGADLSINASASTATLWMLIPGVLLLLVGAPLCAYYYTKIRSGHGSRSDAEILRQAEFESKIPRRSNGKK